MGTIWRVLTRKKVIDPDAVETTRLARVLNTFDLTALGVGSTLGVGVYVLAGHVARDTAGPSVVLSFLIAAIASVFAGLCYAEFGARTPKAGSAYIYSYVCVGEFIAFVIGWNLILEYVIGSASVARGLSLYIDTLINDTLKNTFIDIAPINVSFMSEYFDFFSFGISVLLAVGLAFGMKESSLMNNLFTILNIFVVLFVIIAGSFKADINNWKLPANETTGAEQGGFFPFGIEGMIKGAATCFYGFVGFDCIATTGEEVKNPKKAIPVAIIVSLLIIFLAYFGTSTVITMMVPFYEQDINAPIPHAFAEVGWYVAKWIVAIGGIFGLCASLFGAMFPLPRIIYAMASDGLVFKFLGTVSSRFSTPVIGTLLAGILTGLMSATFELRQLVNMMSIGTLLAYTIVAASVLLLRYEVDEDVRYSLVSTISESDNESYTDSSGIDVDPNLEDTNEDSMAVEDQRCTCCGFVKQFFNCGGLRAPTKFTQKLSTVYVGVFCILALFMGLCAMFLIDEIKDGKLYAIILTAVVGFLILVILMSLSAQPTSNRVLSFKVPLVPLVPALSILINIYLMLMLDANTWIRFGVWMAIGIPMYIICVRSYSRAKNVLVTNESSKNGHLNDTRKSNGITNYGYNNEEDAKDSHLYEKKRDSLEDSGFISNNQKSDYGSIKTLTNDAASVSTNDNEVQQSSETRKSSLNSVDVVLAELDDVISNEIASQSKSALFVNPPNRKVSVDTVSNASNVHVEESVVALVHREDVRSNPASPLQDIPLAFPSNLDTNHTPVVGDDESVNQEEISGQIDQNIIQVNNEPADINHVHDEIEQKKDQVEVDVNMEIDSENKTTEVEENLIENKDDESKTTKDVTENLINTKDSESKTTEDVKEDLTDCKDNESKTTEDVKENVANSEDNEIKTTEDITESRTESKNSEKKIIKNIKEHLTDGSKYNESKSAEDITGNLTDSKNNVIQVTPVLIPPPLTKKKRVVQPKSIPFPPQLDNRVVKRLSELLNKDNGVQANAIPVPPPLSKVSPVIIPPPLIKKKSVVRPRSIQFPPPPDDGVAKSSSARVPPRLDDLLNKDNGVQANAIPVPPPLSDFLRKGSSQASTVPVPPPIGDFVRFKTVRIPRVSSSDKEFSSNTYPHIAGSKGKAPLPPPMGSQAVNSDQDVVLRVNSKPSSNKLRDNESNETLLAETSSEIEGDNVEFGSSRHSKIMAKLNNIFKSQVEHTQPPKRLTIPKVYNVEKPDEQFSRKPNIIQPVVPQVISEIAKNKVSEDNDSETVNRSRDEEWEGVDDRPLSYSDIKRKLTVIYKDKLGVKP